MYAHDVDLAFRGLLTALHGPCVARNFRLGKPEGDILSGLYALGPRRYGGERSTVPTMKRNGNVAMYAHGVVVFWDCAPCVATVVACVARPGGKMLCVALSVAAQALAAFRWFASVGAQKVAPSDAIGCGVATDVPRVLKVR